MGKTVSQTETGIAPAVRNRAGEERIPNQQGRGRAVFFPKEGKRLNLSVVRRRNCPRKNKR